MTQLLAHLVGDYALQSHVMAARKTSSWVWALVHVAFYTLPFLLLTQDPWRLAVIGGTHAVIDRYRLAAYWCRWWGVGFPGIWCMKWPGIAGVEGPAGEDTYWMLGGGKFDAPPPFLGVWLVIIVDNTMHLLINYAVLT